MPIVSFLGKAMLVAGRGYGAFDGMASFMLKGAGGQPLQLMVLLAEAPLSAAWHQWLLAY